MDISVVIPVRDEDGAIEPLHAELRAVLEELDGASEVLWVDDGSSDATPDVLRRVTAEDPSSRALRLERPAGKAAALACGFDRARGGVVCTLDGDGQDDPRDLPRLLESLEEGADLVCGRRRPRRDPPGKRVSSAVYNLLCRTLFGVPVHDINCGMRALRREVLEAVAVYGDRHRILPILAHARGFRLAEVEVAHRPRRSGRTKYGPGRFVTGLLDLATALFLTRFRDRPGHLFGGAGLASILGGGAICAYLAGLRLWTGSIQFRYPLLSLGILLIVAGIQLVTTGFLAELLVARDGPPPRVARPLRADATADAPAGEETPRLEEGAPS